MPKYPIPEKPPGTEKEAKLFMRGLAIGQEERLVSKRRESSGGIVNMTEECRYENSLRYIAGELASGRIGKAVVCVVGVGDKNGPQVVETIQPLRERGIKPVMHLIDRDDKLLGAAVKNAKDKNPSVEINAYRGDLPVMEPPVDDADLVVCTRVMEWLGTGLRMEMGRNRLSAMMRVGGYLLVFHEDIRGTEKFHGLGGFKRIHERGGEFGGVYRKFKREETYKEIMMRANKSEGWWKG